MAHFEWFDEDGLSHPSLVCLAEDDQAAMRPIKELPVLEVRRLISFPVAPFHDFRTFPRIKGYRPQGTVLLMPHPDEDDPWHALVVIYVPVDSDSSDG